MSQSVSSAQEEEEPLFGAPAGVSVSNKTGVPLHRTVCALMQSSNPVDQEKGMGFYRNVLSLLVLQYTLVLVTLSPFCLVVEFECAVNVQPYKLIMSIASSVGTVLSIYFIFSKGHLHKFAWIALFCFTFFVAMGLGLTFSTKSWSGFVMVALAQAIINFAIIGSALQLVDTTRLKLQTASLLCFIWSGASFLVFREIGASWKVAAPVGMGGWVFAMLNLVSIRNTAKHQGPDTYVQSTISILCPPLTQYLIRKHYAHHKKKKQQQKPQPTRTDYGGTDA